MVGHAHVVLPGQLDLPDFSLLRDGNGEEVRTNCTATRENEASNNFNWRCQPADSPAAE